MRLFFGVGGPNLSRASTSLARSSIACTDQGSLTSEPNTNVQTTHVSAGGATMVEFKVEVPGALILVDHALSRLERGLAGFLVVEGPENPAIFHGDGPSSMAGH